MKCKDEKHVWHTKARWGFHMCLNCGTTKPKKVRLAK